MAAAVGQALLMFYQIDWSRLIGVLLLLGAGAVLATRLAGAGQPGGGPLTPSSRLALRGMWLMTLLGLGSGVAGALLENALGQAPLVRILHGMYRVCWAPAFWMSSLQAALAGGDIVSQFFSEVFSLLGVLLVPLLWFGVCLGVGGIRRRLRRA